jgi:hypothetical protein
MQIIVFEDATDTVVVVVEVPNDADVALLLQLIAAETGRNILGTHYIEHDGHPLLSLELTLMQVGLVDGSSVLLKRRSTPPSSSSITSASSAPVAVATNSPQRRQLSFYDIPADIKPEELLELTKSHPHLVSQFQAQDSELGDCLAAQDLAKLRGLMMKRFMSRHKQDFEKKQEIIALEADPSNPELQKKIEERVSSFFGGLFVFSPRYSCHQ